MVLAYGCVDNSRSLRAGCYMSGGWRDNWPEVTEHGCECWLPTLSSTGRRVDDAGRSVSVVLMVHVTAASGVGLRQVSEQDVVG